MTAWITARWPHRESESIDTNFQRFLYWLTALVVFQVGFHGAIHLDPEARRIERGREGLCAA